jgi:hypothetical protein
MKDSIIKFPDQGYVYDFTFNKEQREWMTWTNTVEKYVCDNKLNYGEIVVPTFDSIRMKYLK